MPFCFLLDLFLLNLFSLPIRQHKNSPSRWWCMLYLLCYSSHFKLIGSFSKLKQVGTWSFRSLSLPKTAMLEKPGFSKVTAFFIPTSLARRMPKTQMEPFSPRYRPIKLAKILWKPCLHLPVLVREPFSTFPWKNKFIQWLRKRYLLSGWRRELQGKCS